MEKTSRSVPHAQNMYAVEVYMKLWVLDLADNETRNLFIQPHTDASIWDIYILHRFVFTLVKCDQ